jgi:CRP-like cAMP-binding protein
VKYAVATEETPPRSFSRPSIQEELAATEIFSPLSEEDIELLAAASYERTYHPGDTIIEEGSTDTSLLIITGGAVQVVKTDPRGREVEIDRFGAGDFIGEMALMTGRPRSATVRALVTVRGIIVPKEGLEPILTRNPALSEQIAGIMVERKMKDPQFSKRVQESPTPTSHLLKLYMDKVGRRIADFFKIKRE